MFRMSGGILSQDLPLHITLLKVKFNISLKSDNTTTEDSHENLAINLWQTEKLERDVY